MKKITILLEVDAPDHLSNADIEQAIARMLDIGQADARETEEADEEAQAADELRMIDELAETIAEERESPMDEEEEGF